MTSWYKRVAVVAAWLGLSVAAQAQQTAIPSPVGAARMIEPLGYTPKGPPPNLVPGPMTPEIAPPVPLEATSLPSGHTSAFQCENYPPEDAFFFHAGGVQLRRYRLPSLPLIFLDTQNAVPLLPGQTNTLFGPGGPGAAPIALGVSGLDTGNEPFRPPVLFDLKNMHPEYHLGVRATIGYLLGGAAFEMTGFYVPEETISETYIARGMLSLPFSSSPGGIPIGFQGRNNLWRQADLARVEYLNTIGGAEANYRSWNTGISHVELILGVRWMFVRERLNILTDDENQVRNFADQADPTRAASYNVDVRNNIIGPQFGGEYSFPCTIPYFGWMWFTGVGKACVGPNIISREQQLTRGDGFNAFDVRRTGVRLGQIYELSAFLDLHLLERLRLRAGYQALWLVGVSTPGSQVDFNFSNQGQRAHEYGNQFWHGPSMELQFLF